MLLTYVKRRKVSLNVVTVYHMVENKDTRRHVPNENTRVKNM